MLNVDVSGDSDDWRSLLTSGTGCGCGCGCGEEAVDSAAVVLGQRSEFESGEMFIANKLLLFR